MASGFRTYGLGLNDQKYGFLGGFKGFECRGLGFRPLELREEASSGISGNQTLGDTAEASEYNNYRNP